MIPVCSTRCCIAGGGPAGLMLGLLLARAGVEVLVLEKHGDFLRDFRGDTIHPSTLTVLDDLGLLEEFLELPHQRIERFTADFFGKSVTIADFSHLTAAPPYLVLIPQWHFLDFLSRKAREYPCFHLEMSTRATALIRHEESVVGVRAESATGCHDIRCSLTVAADGRDSTLRQSSGLVSENLGAAIDVLWFRLSRDPHTHVEETGGHIRSGLFLVTLNRQSYWQCAYVIPKGSLERLHVQGLDVLKASLAEAAPFLVGSLAELRGWDDLKLLTVQINRMPRWYREGLLCIGDSAHAMSPVGGVGINLAIQDAVATANILADTLAERRLAIDDLAAVQRRREWPTRITQRMQIAVQDEFLSPLLAGDGSPHRSGTEPALPLPLRLLDRLPMLSRIPARIVGVGIRTERVRSRKLTERPRTADFSGR